MLDFCLLYIHCPQASRTTLQGKSHTGTLFQGVKIYTLQGGAVEENLFPVFCADETEASIPDKFYYLAFQS